MAVVVALSMAQQFALRSVVEAVVPRRMIEEIARKVCFVLFVVSAPLLHADVFRLAVCVLPLVVYALLLLLCAVLVARVSALRPSLYAPHIQPNLLPLDLGLQVTWSKWALVQSMLPSLPVS